MSSGEAEYYSIVKAASNSCGTRAILKDLGIDKGIVLKTDASAAKGITSRRGLGKVRHIEINQLWVQEKVLNGELVVIKIPGKENVSDALTKPVGPGELEFHMRGVELEVQSGRHQLAPQTTGIGERDTHRDTHGMGTSVNVVRSSTQSPSSHGLNRAGHREVQDGQRAVGGGLRALTQGAQAASGLGGHAVGRRQRAVAGARPCEARAGRGPLLNSSGNGLNSERPRESTLQNGNSIGKHVCTVL